METENQVKTKTCPFCGEEVLITAQKCKHCGEFFTQENIARLKYSQYGIDEKWYALFDLVETYWVDGKWWKPSPAYKKLSFWDRGNLNRTVAGCDALWGWYLFGPFDYFRKGMWLKGIVYTVIACIPPFIGLALFGYTAWDYYRYVVKNEQW